MFLPPAWTLWDDGQTLTAHRHPDGAQVLLSGHTRHAALRGHAHPALVLMGQHDEEAGALCASLSRHGAPAPLQRATLLRGAGFGQLFLELTARCNERCLHCYAESSPERDETLDEGTITRVLDDGARLGFQSVQLTGGDPLVSPHCTMAARHAAAVGISTIEVYTNGLALGGELYKALREVGVDFAFSYYCHVPEVHDRITGMPGSQRRTTAAIQRVLSDGLRVRVNLIVMDDNHALVEDTLAALLDMGLPSDSIGMDVQRSVGRGLMTIAETDPRYQRVRNLARARTHRTGTNAALLGRAAVAYDGTVYPCIFSRALPLGHLSQAGLADILEAPMALTLRPEVLLGHDPTRRAQMSCWDCRLRAGLLSGPSHPVACDADAEAR